MRIVCPLKGMGVKKKNEGAVEHGFSASSLGIKVDVSAIHWDETKMQTSLLGKIMSPVRDTL